MTGGDWVFVTIIVVFFQLWPICCKLDGIRSELRAIREALEDK